MLRIPRCRSVAFSFLDRDKDGRVSFAEIHGLLRAEVPSFQEAELAPVLTSVRWGQAKRIHCGTLAR